jgi:protein SCO1/2
MAVNAKFLDGAAASTWSELCGQPPGILSTALLLVAVGAVTSVVAAGALALMNARRLTTCAIALGIGLTSAGLGYAAGQVSLAANAPPPSGTFAVLDPPRTAANFFLRNTHGGMTELRDFAGKTTVMFFGYTHCPDVCPTTLSEYKRIKRALGPDADQVVFVFISVDGERDTPHFLDKYISLFDKDFVALTAHSSVVHSMLRDYGGDFRVEPIPGSDGYKVLHTADSYVIDAQGRWRTLIPINMPTDEAAQAIRDVILDSANRE